MTLPALVVLALSNRQLINAHSSMKLVENYSGGPIYITQSHARYILSRLNQQGYVVLHPDSSRSNVKNYIITELGKRRLGQEVDNLRYTYNSLRFLASGLN